MFSSGFFKNHSHRIISERKICLYSSFLGPPIPPTGSITVACNLCIFRQSLHVRCLYLHTYDIVLVFKVLEKLLQNVSVIENQLDEEGMGRVTAIRK